MKSIIIPAYNEELRIKQVILDLIVNFRGRKLLWSAMEMIIQITS